MIHENCIEFWSVRLGEEVKCHFEFRESGVRSRLFMKRILDVEPVVACTVVERRYVECSREYPSVMVSSGKGRSVLLVNAGAKHVDVSIQNQLYIESSICETYLSSKVLCTSKTIPSRSNVPVR